MRTRRSRIVLEMLLMQFVVALAVAPTLASACTCPWPNHWGFVAPEVGRLPANAVGIPLYSPGGGLQLAAEEIAQKVTVEIKEDGVFRAVPAMARKLDSSGMYVVGPEDGLKAASTYRFTDRASGRASEAPRTVVVTVDHEALEAGASLIAKVHPLRPGLESTLATGGMCSQRVWVSRARVITLLPDIPREWLEQLLYVTVVDGDRHWIGERSLCHVVPPGRSRIQTGWSLLYGKCPPPPGVEDPAFLSVHTLSPEPHTVQVQASLPGTSIMLKAPTVTVDLSCRTE